MKEPIAFVHFYSVPIGTFFRYHKNWWEKRTGTDALSCSNPSAIISLMMNRVVGVRKKDLKANDPNILGEVNEKSEYVCCLDQFEKNL